MPPTTTSVCDAILWCCGGGSEWAYKAEEQGRDDPARPRPESCPRPRRCLPDQPPRFLSHQTSAKRRRTGHAHADRREDYRQAGRGGAWRQGRGANRGASLATGSRQLAWEVDPFLPLPSQAQDKKIITAFVCAPSPSPELDAGAADAPSTIAARSRRRTPRRCCSSRCRRTCRSCRSCRRSTPRSTRRRTGCCAGPTTTSCRTSSSRRRRTGRRRRC